MLARMLPQPLPLSVLATVVGVASFVQRACVRKHSISAHRYYVWFWVWLAVCVNECIICQAVVIDYGFPFARMLTRVWEVSVYLVKCRE